MSGLDATGFEPKRLQEIREEIETQLVAELGVSLSFGGDTVLGQLVGVLAQQIALVWEGEGALYRALDPEQAVGESLRIIARLRGVVPQGAERAFGTISITATAGTIIPAGSRARNPTTGVAVETVGSTTVGSGGTAVIAVQTVEPGAAVSAVNGITQIVTPVAGWSAITASSVLSGGRDAEDDVTLYNRLTATRNVTSAVEGAIRARLLAVEGVEAAIVLSNRTMTTDANGTPPKALRCILSPNLTGNPLVEAAIAQAIFSTMPAGIEPAGIGSTARLAQVVDAQGFLQDVRWEYVQGVPIIIEAAITVVAAETTLDAAQSKAAAEAALRAQLEALSVGQDVVVAQLQGALFAGVPGLLNITDFRLDAFTDPPVGTTSIVLAFNELATPDVVDVTVTLV